MFKRSNSVIKEDAIDSSSKAKHGEFTALLIHQPTARDKETNKSLTLQDSWHIIRQKEMDSSWSSELCHFVCTDNFHELNKWQRDNCPEMFLTRDCFGDTVLHFAVFNGQEKMTEYLLKYIDINIQGFCGKTPLHWAVGANHYNIVVLLIEHGAHLDVQDKEFAKCPMHYATSEGQTDIVQLLLDKGCKADLRDIYERTPLHLASSMDRREIIALLISHGVDVNAQTKGGWTPLHYAIRNRKIDTVVSLLKADVNVNIKDIDGISAFQLAYYENNLEITNLLLDNIVNLVVSDNATYNVVERAMRLNVPDVLRCLIVKNNKGMEDEEGAQDEELTVEYLESRLDDCIGRHKRTIYVNFSPLLPSNFRNFCVILLIFLCMTKEKKFERLLLHPTVRIFLHWKWKQVAKYFYLNLLVFLIICLNIISYQILFYCTESDALTNVGYFSNSLIITSIILLACRVSLQMYVHFESYVKNIENYYELALIIYLFVLLCWHPDLKSRVQVSAVGNILIALTLTMVIGHYPLAISAVHLLKMVTYKFFKYFVVYLIIILSFALTFYQLYAFDKDANKFGKENGTALEERNLLDYPELSILRTIGMFIGELNLNDFSSQKYSFMLITMLLLFIIFVSVIILNLLNGLAICNVLEKGDLKISRTKSQLEYLYNLTNTIDLIIAILDSLKAARFTNKIPVTQLNKEIKNIFIVPRYIDEKTLLLDADHVLVHSNKIHKDAYERFKKKEGVVQTKKCSIKRDAKESFFSRNLEEIQTKINIVNDVMVKINESNQMLATKMNQLKIEFRDVKEKMVEITKI